VKRVNCHLRQKALLVSLKDIQTIPTHVRVSMSERMLPSYLSLCFSLLVSDYKDTWKQRKALEPKIS